MGMVAHTYNPGTQEDETGGLPRVQCQPGLQSKNPSQKKKESVSCIYLFKTNLLARLTFMPLMIFSKKFF